jgi:Ca2+-transporting ATPase
VICSDKTGTLTRNEMTVREIVTPKTGYRLSGVGYTPKGEIEANGQRVDPSAQSDLRQALTVATWCNSARLTSNDHGWQVIGDPTEGALLVAAMKASIGIERSQDQGTILFEIPFDSDRKAMSVVVRRGDGATMFTKGAPEVVLRLCTEELRDDPIPLSDERRAAILSAGTEMASRALRVLGLAYRPVVAGTPADYREEKLIFAGLVGMIDPPRDEVKAAVATCHDAGIRPVMITGDHPATAMAIARELHIADADSRVVTGQELQELTDAQLAAQVEQISVYARVSAEHKLRVVRAWRTRGQVVAMTGDGVNDAPAVKEADIGIAMGVTGTDVTKDASDMVLMDDNFASIVSAVEEGRCIYDNIQKVIQYLLSCNVGEILLMLVASLAGWPAPLIPVQLLWINLVTDGLPALALSFEPAEPGIMKRRPRPARESILNWATGGSILFQGALVAAATLAAFGIVYSQYPDDPGRARTVAFCVLVYGELLRAFVARSQSIPLWRLGFFNNMPLIGAIAISVLLQMSVVTMPFARPFFESAEHFGSEWLLIVLLAPLPAVVIELTKVFKRGSAVSPERGVL